MSFLKKTLASFGIGSAKVDLVLQQEVLYPWQKGEHYCACVWWRFSRRRSTISILICAVVKCQRSHHELAKQEGGQTRRMHQTYSLAKWSLPAKVRLWFSRVKLATLSVSLMFRWTHRWQLGDSKWLETGLDKWWRSIRRIKIFLTVRPDALLDGIFTSWGLRATHSPRRVWSGWWLWTAVCSRVWVCSQLLGHIAKAGASWRWLLIVMRKNLSYGLK